VEGMYQYYNIFDDTIYLNNNIYSFKIATFTKTNDYLVL
jgi:hypothetical protein